MNLVTLPNEAFSAPCGDSRFSGLPDDVSKLVCQRLAAMQEIAAAPKKAAAIAAIAARRRGERGWGKGTLVNLWYSFARTRCWTSLLDKARGGRCFWNTTCDGLPETFVEWMASQWSMRQRDKFRSAWVDLKAQYARWRQGDDSVEIPGYDVCPKPDPRTNLPIGWTYENLLRVAKKNSSRYARKLIQIGPKAAQQMTYKVPTTRDGVEVGEVYIFDDVWNDFRVLHRGKGSRILSLHCLELKSACACLAGHKPTCENESGVEERLKDYEMVMLAVAVLSTIGYRPQGTMFVCEKRTAALPQAVVDLLQRILGDLFRYETGPAGGGPGVSGLFADRSGGNPRWKAPIESFFNLLHNRCDHMLEFPGQLGSNSRLNLPEGTAKMEIADEAMARARQLLTPERQQQIRFNLLQYENARPILDARIEFCNTRREHELEGWRACGHFVPAFRLAESMDWLPFTMIDRLAPDQQAQLRVMLAANPNLIGEIKLSPREVFDAGKTRLKKLTPPQVALLMSETPGDERSVKKGIIEFEAADVDPCRPLAFGPTIRDCNGREDQMGSDDKFLVRVNPYAPGHAFLYNAKGGFIGIARSRGRAGTRLDHEALQTHFKAKQTQVSAWTKEARQLAAPISQRADEIVSTNAAVIADQQREETRVDRRLDRRARATASTQETDFSALGGGATPQSPVQESGPSMDELNKL